MGSPACPTAHYSNRSLGTPVAVCTPARRLRANLRVVKRKMSKFGVKRSEHRNWP